MQREKANLRIFYAPHHRYRPGDYETWKIVSPYLKDRLEFEGLRRRHVGRPDPQRVRTLKRVKSWPKSIGVRADSPTRTWTRCPRNTASINSSSWGSAHILVWSRQCDFAAELGY